MDHKEQHHQRHQKEREEKKKEHREYMQSHPAEDRAIFPVHPKWLFVAGVGLTLVAILAWLIVMSWW